MDEPPPKARAVLDVVALIPAGSVLSYGDVASLAGLGAPRYVGHVLARFGDGVPWHRVVMADGTFAPHLAHEQAALLRAEATPLTTGNDGVDMARARLS